MTLVSCYVLSFDPVLTPTNHPITSNLFTSNLGPQNIEPFNKHNHSMDTPHLQKFPIRQNLTPAGGPVECQKTSTGP